MFQIKRVERQTGLVMFWRSVGCFVDNPKLAKVFDSKEAAEKVLGTYKQIFSMKYEIVTVD